ncbi:hypothetical protein AALO_G00183050 [Alosa alosa]|uniref:Phosphatidylinositol-specific phospholipase C X domain-containing protein n=1 Tax=Alosa alosa TaxID=278164 RepID=A0AAV6G990_9TELE|nr:1-phosphatidylinositol phosphodiesterase-like [Alosa alosa]KAG5271703.1 hypothetical protein AALO_G00183050 [Alosa alosa]
MNNVIWKVIFVSLLMTFEHMSCSEDQSFNDASVLRLPQSYHIDWMRSIDDNKLISDITIPGTHDTMALHGGPAAECQAWSLADQLRAGIRYLDLRVFAFDHKLYIMHGVIYQHTTFTDVLSTLRDFLKEYRSEAVFVRVKPDGQLFDKDEVEGLVEKLIVGDEDFWVESAIPRMGEVRGKIVLLQKDSFKLGIPILGTDKKGDYEVTHIPEKERMIETHLKEAEGACGGGDYVVLSYSSGTGIGTLEGMFLTPKRVAEKIDPWFYGYLNKLDPEKGSCFGIIAMDFPGLNLIQTVINLNTF